MVHRRDKIYFHDLQCILVIYQQRSGREIECDKMKNINKLRQIFLKVNIREEKYTVGITTQKSLKNVGIYDVVGRYIGSSVSDPHFIYADPGKNLHVDPDPDPGGKGKR